MATCLKKRCTKCKEEKPLSEFSIRRNREGIPCWRLGSCQSCVRIRSNLRNKEYRQRHLLRLQAKSRNRRAEIKKSVQRFPNKSKKCSVCGRTKFHREFAKDTATLSGYSHRCLKCKRKAAKAYRNTRRGRRLKNLASRRFYVNHLEEKKAYAKRYHVTHKDKHRKQLRSWRRRHPIKYRRQFQRARDLLYPSYVRMCINNCFEHEFGRRLQTSQIPDSLVRVVAENIKLKRTIGKICQTS